MEELIIKYLQNNLTRKEEEELKAWLQQDPLNRVLFENAVGQWKISQAEVEAAKKRVLDSITSQKIDIAPAGVKHNYRKIALRIAASLVVILTVALTLYNGSGFFETHEQTGIEKVIIEKEAANGQKLSFTLPDGTLVQLNAGTVLRYPEHFNGNSREVSLAGEAFFEVTHDAARPFTITSGQMKVRVLGTSFNVRAFPGDLMASVSVLTGKVGVTIKEKKESITLLPGDMAMYDNTSQRIKKQLWTSHNMAFGWTQQNLAFENLELEEILKILSRWFAVDFEFNSYDGSSMLFTATYRNPTLEEVMESLGYAYNFKYVVDNNKVIIKQH